MQFIKKQNFFSINQQLSDSHLSKSCQQRIAFIAKDKYAHIMSLGLCQI